MIISLEAKLDDAMDLLKGLDVNEKKIRSSVLNQVGTKAKNAAKKDYRNVLNKKSGFLYKSIRKYMYRNKNAVVVTAHGKEDPVRYGFVLAKGPTIQAKNADYLTFEANGKWIKKKEVHLKPHDFIVKPVERYLDSNQLDSDMDTILQKKIDQIEAKKRVTNA